jgi:hypothetical protein
VTLDSQSFAPQVLTRHCLALPRAFTTFTWNNFVA